MTRKRFIKLLMAVRFQRNEANNMADMALLIYGSYKVAWERKYKYTAAVRRALISAAYAVSKINKAVIEVWAHMRELTLALRRHEL